MRTLLFVPGDRPERFAKAVASGADGVIFDLEDSVVPAHRIQARQEVSRQLTSGVRSCEFWVRINPVQTSDALEDLSAVLQCRPDGIMLPKPRSIDDVSRLDHWLEALGAQAGLAQGSVAVIPIVTETAISVLRMGGYAELPARVTALTWGAEDLAAELGAENRSTSGTYTPPFELARSLCLLAATAAGVIAMDTIDPEIEDCQAVAQRAKDSHRLGFAAKMAIHPKQIAPIHEAFAPTEAEIAWATRVKEAFDSVTVAGAVALDGRMLDRPHLRQAQRLLNAAGKR